MDGSKQNPKVEARKQALKRNLARRKQASRALGKQNAENARTADEEAMAVRKRGLQSLIGNKQTPDASE